MSDADISVRSSVETLRVLVARRFRRDVTLLTDMSSKSDALSSSSEQSAFFFLLVMVHRKRSRDEPVGSRRAGYVGKEEGGTSKPQDR